ncbi:nucleotidyltransferase family protein [Paenibacillus sp. 1011MAR3C5]|uniref:nucleotidyltransferase family protein n=1 Tax=Paenibacillus sp. 1011MAR3C5 TaxID=1675787 RepID=UPI000E6D1A27|nr:nucleotidyltransferase family protein [Paenibacillus sp. 1011MAR3C5]RJE90522.1 nucleotidyltransferase family protein [Paenibacillus sp. 1011MAR3C5]
MKIENERDMIRLVKEDKWMMDILHHVQTLQLPDWWVCAGFVRSKVWDALHGFTLRTPLPDVDVIYFDNLNLDEANEKQLEQRLKQLDTSIPWSVKNEARMHVANNIPPYSSSVDAISKFPETATALGLSLDEQGEVVLAAPCGIKDVLGLNVRPTPYFKQTDERTKMYEERIRKKNWVRTWYRINIIPVHQA